MERLETYKRYQLDGDRLVKVKIDELDINKAFIYITTTPTTPFNFEFQIRKDNKVLYSNWSDEALGLISRPDIAARMLKDY